MNNRPKSKAGLALMLAAGLAGAGGTLGGEGNRGLSLITAKEAVPYATIGVCMVRPKADQMIINDRTGDQVYSVHASTYALYGLEFKEVPISEDDRIVWLDNSRIAVVEQPSHGVLRQTSIAYTPEKIIYIPESGFVGNDNLVVMVDGYDRQDKYYAVKIVYSINVVDDIERKLFELNDLDRNALLKELCNGKPEAWLISTAPFSSDSAHISPQFLLAQSGLDSSAVTLQIADLGGSAVGQTTNTTITLDTTAAGHGWYIDYTPYLNEEYLPTSNPNEWVEKEGTAAYGKMDLLSVLWHEYDHAMGFDHSSDSLPTEPDTPLPDGPLPPNNGSVRVTRARITREGTFVTGEDGVERNRANSRLPPTRR